MLVLGGTDKGVFLCMLGVVSAIRILKWFSQWAIINKRHVLGSNLLTYDVHCVAKSYAVFNHLKSYLFMIYDIFINCSWVVTRWQYTFTHKRYI